MTTARSTQPSGSFATQWGDLLSRFTVRSGDARLDRMVNVWNQYQCMTTYNMARSASYFESGIGRGIGFRDTSQDLLGCVHQVPARARQRLLDVAATQFPDGGAWHQYQPLTKQGNGTSAGTSTTTPCGSSLAWPATSRKQETGPSSMQRSPSTRPAESPPRCSSTCGALSITSWNNLGPHGLPLIGHADWNDCLNLNCFSTDPNESFQTTVSRDGKTAESVMIAGMFVLIGEDFIQICRRTGHSRAAKDAAQRIEDMRSAILAHGWDGDWYLRAYDSFGQKVGSQENRDGKIYVEANAWCAMAQVGASQGYPRKALDAVKERLATRFGIMILDPPYREYHRGAGRGLLLSARVQGKRGSLLP